MSPDKRSNNEGTPSNAGAVIAPTLLNAVAKQLPSSQERRGDNKLHRAREMTNEFETVIAENDRRTIEDKITHAREMRVGLDAHSGISKYMQAREYRRAARDAYRYAKEASDRGMETARFQHQPCTSSGPEDIYSRVTRTARSLYGCLLSCKVAFPSPGVKEELAKAVWIEACAWEGAYQGPYTDLPLRQDEEFVYSSTTLITDIKVKIRHAVESSYEFSTSRAPDSISRNATRAQALLTKMTFVYGELNFGGRLSHPYRHPIIQKVINITWFQNKDSDGIVFHEYFTPIPIGAITLALTVIECCIDEWSDGTWKESNRSEERYKAVYLSHLYSLRDFRDHGHHLQSGDLLAQIQQDLLKNARMHAGAPPDPITGSGRLSIEALNAAIRDDLPEYDQIPAITIDDAN